MDSDTTTATSSAGVATENPVAPQGPDRSQPAPAPILSRATLKGAPSGIETERVEIPEWNGSVLVRGLTGKGRDDFEASLMVGKGKKAQVSLQNIRAKLIVRSCVTETGDRLFHDGDEEWLGEKSSAILERIADVARRLSGLSESDIDEMVAELGKDRSAGSGSA